MPYALGAVKPHVKAQADLLGPKYGFTVIYGWGPGSIPGSDHPKGLALDFMTKDKAQGDALVNDLMANAGPYAVKYIVWYRRSWNPKDGWKPYSSTPNPHTDHVHVSYLDTPGSGPIQNVAIPNPLKGAEELFERLTWITRRENWIRIGLFSAGFVLTALGLVALLGKDTKDVSTVVKVVGAVKKAGKVVK